MKSSFLVHCFKITEYYMIYVRLCFCVIIMKAMEKGNKGKNNEFMSPVYLVLLCKSDTTTTTSLILTMKYKILRLTIQRTSCPLYCT